MIETTTPIIERDEWRTPPAVFGFFNRRFGFAWDLAATEQNTLCDDWFTRENDALSRPWADYCIGGVGWCNPPYSNIDPWLDKAYLEAHRGFTSVFLIPAPSGEERYGKYVFGHASEVVFITGRLAFLRPDGTPQSGNRWGSIAVVYRARDLGNTRYSNVWRDHMIADVRKEAA